VLAGTTVTNTGYSALTGGLGLSPGTAVTGFPPGISGTQDLSDAAAIQAQSDLVTGYDDAASATSNDNLSGTDLGGLTLSPGVYTFSSSAQLTGPLTLAGDGVFIFQIGSTLTTASNSEVSLVGGAQACAVYWQVGSSATLGTGTQFQGTVMAFTSITMVTGSSSLGRMLARNGAVTLDNNDITAPSGTCTAGAAPYTPPATSAASPTSSSTATTPSGSPSGSASSTATPSGNPSPSSKSTSSPQSSPIASLGSTTTPGGPTNAPPPESGAATPNSVLPGLLLMLVGGGDVALALRRGSGVAPR
jgi:type VI secretion system secreted protein VgrG